MRRRKSSQWIAAMSQSTADRERAEDARQEAREHAAALRQLNDHQLKTRLANKRNKAICHVRSGLPHVGWPLGNTAKARRLSVAACRM